MNALKLSPKERISVIALCDLCNLIVRQHNAMLPKFPKSQPEYYQALEAIASATGIPTEELTPQKMSEIAKDI